MSAYVVFGILLNTIIMFSLELCRVMLVPKCRGEAQLRLPVGILSGSIGITLWDCEGSMEPSRLGWDCRISSHLALNESCDDTEALP